MANRVSGGDGAESLSHNPTSDQLSGERQAKRAHSMGHGGENSHREPEVVVAEGRDRGDIPVLRQARESHSP